MINKNPIKKLFLILLPLVILVVHQQIVFASQLQTRLANININWWDNFSDPYLKIYIYKAICNNHEIKKAALKTEEYRQMIKISRSYEYPSVMLSPSFARIKTAQNQIFDIETATVRTNLYAIPLFAKYEADIFLKNHDKTGAAKKEFEMAKYEEKAADITISADVASLYINIIKLDKIIKTQEKINNIRKNIRDLTAQRHSAGLASVYDVTYTDKLHTESQIELNDLKRQQKLYLHQLAVYIDESPSCAENLPRGNFDNLEYKDKIPDCISSEAVIFRPDIMKAEANLEKAKIDIRVARKEFLPSIPIIATAGYNSLLLKDLFNWENIFALVGVSAMQKIFTGGYLNANLKKKKLVYEQIFEEYKQADLTAIQEINDALCMIKYDTQKDNDNMKKVKLESDNFKLVMYRYQEGIISYLEMIQFQETLLSLQTEKDNSKAQRLVDYITLYKATGTKVI